MSQERMRILRLFICQTSRSKTERGKIRLDFLYIIGVGIPDKEEI